MEGVDAAGEAERARSASSAGVEVRGVGGVVLQGGKTSQCQPERG